jgi:hypothetical protein
MMHLHPHLCTCKLHTHIRTFGGQCILNLTSRDICRERQQPQASEFRDWRAINTQSCNPHQRFHLSNSGWGIPRLFTLPPTHGYRMIGNRKVPRTSGVDCEVFLLSGKWRMLLSGRLLPMFRRNMLPPSSGSALKT